MILKNTSPVARVLKWLLKRFAATRPEDEDANRIVPKSSATRARGAKGGGPATAGSPTMSIIGRAPCNTTELRRRGHNKPRPALARRPPPQRRVRHAQIWPHKGTRVRANPSLMDRPKSAARP